MLELAPIRAQADRITGVYVCTRPFRAAGPRIETQRLGEKTLVHNYGHGGSGWSLSWGSSTLAVRMAQETGVRKLGVIGCGALGLTSALLAQRAGMSVRIYAKALPPDVYSMRASGLWTPDSRICDAQHAPEFGARWETMARTSYAMYQSSVCRGDRSNGSTAIRYPTSRSISRNRRRSPTSPITVTFTIACVTSRRARSTCQPAACLSGNPMRIATPP